MRFHDPHPAEFHRFNGRKPKALPDWARPFVRYGAMFCITALCFGLALASLPI